MKILNIISSLTGGGKERRLVQLVKGLNEADSEIKLYIVLLQPKFDYEEASKYAEIIILDNASRIACVKSVFCVIKRIKPDIVHEWSGVPLVVTCLSILKSVYHFKLIEGFVADGNPIKQLQAKIASRIAFMAADAVVSNSRAGLKAKHAPLAKSHVIYNGFDFDRFRSVHHDDITGLRKELGIADECKVVSMLARMEPAKNWKMFLEVAKRMGEKRTDVVFLAVGKGTLLDEMRSRVKTDKLANVKVLGFRKDVERIIKSSYLTLLFSNEHVHAEGVSNSIMESMAAGVPVVATMGGGTPEIISNGIDGFIVAPADSNDAAQKIVLLIDDNHLRHEMSQRAIQKIRDKFLLENMVGAYLDLYNSRLKS